jgi:hypothetical protein
MHTDIHVLSGIRANDPSVPVSEDVHALDSAATVIGSAPIWAAPSLSTPPFLE